MNNSAIYPWQTAYVSAILEFEPKKLSAKIKDAVCVIQELMKGCRVEKCERRYLEDAGGYGRIGEENNFIFVSEWGQKASLVELG